MQKVNSTHKKERKQQKGGSKGQKAVCKIENGNGRNVPKAKERGKGQKQYKKGKKTAVVLAKQKYASFWQSKLK